MLRRDTDGTTFCVGFEAIQLLQKKWNLHIVQALLSGPMGFNELGRATGGCNPATLSERLGRLEALELVVRTVEQVMPPRTSYRLTERGLELEEVIAAIARWESRRMTGKLATPASLSGLASRSPRS